MEQGGEHSGGFTIVETLIVLAVTGVLLASAMLVINGRQASTQFQTGINDLQQQLQQVINQSLKGYYSNNGSFNCAGTSGSPVIAGGGGDLGSSDGCIFMGTLFQFGASNQPTQYDTFPVAGADHTSDGTEYTKLSDTNPIVVSQFGEHTTMPSGLSVYRAYLGTDPTDSGAQIGAFGVLAGNSIDGSFASFNGSTLNSGSEPFTLYAIKATTISDLGSTDDLVSAFALPANRVITPTVSICVTDNNGKSAIITVGGSNSSLGVSIAVKSGNTC